MPISVSSVPTPCPAPPPIRLGIDLGGTKIEIAALDTDGNFILRQRCPTPQGDYAGTLAATAQLVQQAEQQLGIAGQLLPIGIGIPGSLSPITKRVRNANSTVLNGHMLLPEMVQALGGREVHIANDANCLALSEAQDGAGHGHEVVFAVILGTGVGAGIAVQGRLLNGCNGIAGEWGHNLLAEPQAQDKPAPPCWCGQHNCNETWLSGPAFAADHQRHTGQALPPDAIVAAMRAGDMQAQATFNRYVPRLAQALAQIVNVLDPDVVVLGGGMSNVRELYEAVPRIWHNYVFSDHCRTLLKPAQHGDSSGVRGAAFLPGMVRRG